MAQSKSSLLGEIPLSKNKFPELASLLESFKTKKFLALIDRQRSEEVNRALLHWIEKTPEPCFLLPHVLEFIEKVDHSEILHHYTLNSFELWLNQFSGLSFEDNYRVRGKIAGKWVERSEYQALFPIGMGKVYEGTHFVTAHKSPDLDTTVASFWGWLDAFAARVSEGLHVWNLPGGPPASQIEIDWIFRDVLGPAVFTHLAKTRTALSVIGNDLLSKKGFLLKTPSDSITEVDHERDQNAVVIADSEGFYLGDWRSLDVEGVRQVIILFSSCLRWFENHLNLQLISLFAKEKLHWDDVASPLKKLFELPLIDCEPAQEFSAKQKQQVSNFLKHVIGAHKGLKSTFEELGVGLARLSGESFRGLEEVLATMKEAQLFDAKGRLLEERPRIFSFLEKVVRELHEGIYKIRARLETLDIALKTKSDVFGHHPTYVSARTEVEEIRSKMASYPYLTVISPDRDRLYPVGVILATDLRKTTLGTVSLRDFCNREEMTIPSYLEVISVIDHHKSALHTFSAPLAVISDVQSSNTLVAQLAFQINDPYSLAGQSAKEIEAGISEHAKDSSPLSTRLLRRLLKRRVAAERKGHFFIHPEREFLEYLHFLYAILDDTDLLSKVSVPDVECVASLLNRMKTLSLSKETEIVSLDDLVRDRSFPKKAAQRLLQNEDMYSLYQKVYAYREKEVEKNLKLCAKNEPSNLFADTKEQNGCCRVGQTKVFANNLRSYEKLAPEIRRVWLEMAQEVNRKAPEIDLHIHMISTIVSAEEVYKGSQEKHAHKDEMWIWVPQEETAIEHLKRFLSAFQASAGLKGASLEVEFLGANGEELAAVFKESFLEIPQKQLRKECPIAVLRYRAGALNSRKAMVSPYLPSLSS